MAEFGKVKKEYDVVFSELDWIHKVLKYSPYKKGFVLWRNVDLKVIGTTTRLYFT